ncbi:MAG: alpha-amylase family protein [Proteiniphilum sp.]|nr:alpha-amylase family protein [Proteiniphilum sp.]
MQNNKFFIYQLFPRLIGNSVSRNKINGSIEENGCGKFNDITNDLLKKIKESGYTHVWYIGILAHASTTDYTAYGMPKEYPEIIKGKAGSPYAVRDFFDVDPDLAEDIPNRMVEFDELITRTHKAGLKVVIDNVPNHVARNYRSVSKPKGIKDFGEEDDSSIAFSAQNNFYYLPGQPLDIQLAPDKMVSFSYNESPAKVTGNDCFTNAPTQFDWYETVKLNYGVDYINGNAAYFDPVPDTWKKMKEILLFWAEKEVDGFRCDMAEMVPLEFWQWVVPQVKVRFPKIIFMAEIYNPSAYRDFLSHNTFDYLYDKVALYDVLRDVACGYRPSSDITFTLNSVGDIQDRMLNFMENHDEQRIASDYFLKDGDKGKSAMILTCSINTNPVMINAGQELGEKGMDEEGFSGKNGRTTIYDYWSVDTLHRWNNNGKWNSKRLTRKEKELQDFYSRLIRVCKEEDSISGGLFYDLMPANYENSEFDSTRLFAFLRSNKKELLLVVANFDHEVKDCTVRIPPHAYSFLGIEDTGEGKLTALLKKGEDELLFTYDYPFRIKLDPHSGEIYRISFL